MSSLQIFFLSAKTLSTNTFPFINSHFWRYISFELPYFVYVQHEYTLYFFMNETENTTKQKQRADIASVNLLSIHEPIKLGKCV